MLKKISTIAVYTVFALVSAVVYGLFAFYIIYRDLAGGSMLHTYLWNVVLIIVILLIDKLILARMQSKEFIVTKKNYIFALWMHIENYVSFRTTIYLFYIFILVASRVSTIDPGLVSEDFRSFVLSIEYGLILVIAFDKLIEHLYKDIKRVKIVSDKFKKYLSEKPK